MLRTRARSQADEEPAAVAPPVGVPTLLVVDDHPAIRELLRDELIALGYRVMTAPSAENALALLTGAWALVVRRRHRPNRPMPRTKPQARPR